MLAHILINVELLSKSTFLTTWLLLVSSLRTLSFLSANRLSLALLSLHSYSLGTRSYALQWWFWIHLCILRNLLFPIIWPTEQALRSSALSICTGSGPKSQHRKGWSCDVALIHGAHSNAELHSGRWWPYARSRTRGLPWGVFPWWGSGVVRPPPFSRLIQMIRWSDRWWVAFIRVFSVLATLPIQKV